jgi:chemotaxis signal transduction protein
MRSYLRRCGSRGLRKKCDEPDAGSIRGALADSVEEVIDLELDQIEPAPKIGTQTCTD